MDDAKEISGIDDDILQQIVDLCESKMGEPLGKKKAEVAAIPEEGETPAEESAEGKAAPEDDISPEDLDELLKMSGG